MRKPAHILIKDYDYPLRNEQIAKFPLENRDHSKLLVYREGYISEKHFSDSPDLLEIKDILYFNTTRVVQARILFRKESGAKIEIFCLEPLRPTDHQLAFSSTSSVDFLCLVGNSKKWKQGKLQIAVGQTKLEAENLGRQDDKFLIRFSWGETGISFAEILEKIGSTPIPPYLNRDAIEDDVLNYQTIYARENGSVAAPTAGLHFTPDVLSRMEAKGVQFNDLTLHVGAGTFIPVKSENAVDHSMHAELVSVDKALLLSLLQGRRRIAVGTTSTRSLESLYWLGVKAHSNTDFSFENLFLGQWDAYELNDHFTLEESILALLNQMENVKIESFSFHTQIMITPGYSFRIIDGLFTNFHQPKSTLLLLIAAIVGDDWKKIYSYAMENNFRFLSYGDSSLLFRSKS